MCSDGLPFPLPSLPLPDQTLALFAKLDLSILFQHRFSLIRDLKRSKLRRKGKQPDRASIRLAALFLESINGVDPACLFGSDAGSSPCSSDGGRAIEKGVNVDSLSRKTTWTARQAQDWAGEIVDLLKALEDGQVGEDKRRGDSRSRQTLPLWEEGIRMILGVFSDCEFPFGILSELE